VRNEVKLIKNVENLTRNGQRSTFFIEWKGKAPCLICREAVAVLKDFNINRHYETSTMHMVKIFQKTIE